MNLSILKKAMKMLWNSYNGLLICSIFINLDSSFAQNGFLRVSEPVDSVIVDLKIFIPNYMNNENIPGVQIALIKEGEIAWSEGFGVANPKFLKVETAEALRTSQIKLSDNLAWGMGPGIFYTEQGYALWQWGQHFDFQSIMIIFPEHEFGVVVCTNNDLLNPDVAYEIAYRALGGVIQPLLGPFHLQYDYKEHN
ncbi:MAG: hypothetical protein ABFS12_13175 [Bacteroidota bacterium]